MDLSKRFEGATSITTVSTRSLEINKMYPIVHAKRINTKFGCTVLLSIQDSKAKIVKIFYRSDTVMSFRKMIWTE